MPAPHLFWLTLHLCGRKHPTDTAVQATRRSGRRTWRREEAAAAGRCCSTINWCALPRRPRRHAAVLRHDGGRRRAHLQVLRAHGEGTAVRLEVARSQRGCCARPSELLLPLRLVRRPSRSRKRPSGSPRRSNNRRARHVRSASTRAAGSRRQARLTQFAGARRALRPVARCTTIEACFANHEGGNWDPCGSVRVWSLSLPVLFPPGVAVTAGGARRSLLPVCKQIDFPAKMFAPLFRFSGSVRVLARFSTPRDTNRRARRARL